MTTDEIARVLRDEEVDSDFPLQDAMEALADLIVKVVDFRTPILTYDPLSAREGVNIDIERGTWDCISAIAKARRETRQ